MAAYVFDLVEFCHNERFSFHITYVSLRSECYVVMSVTICHKNYA